MFRKKQEWLVAIISHLMREICLQLAPENEHRGLHYVQLRRLGEFLERSTSRLTSQRFFSEATNLTRDKIL